MRRPYLGGLSALAALALLSGGSLPIGAREDKGEPPQPKPTPPPAPTGPPPGRAFAVNLRREEEKPPGHNGAKAMARRVRQMERAAENARKREARK